MSVIKKLSFENLLINEVCSICSYPEETQDKIIHTLLGLEGLREGNHLKIVLLPMGFMYKEIIQNLGSIEDLSIEESQGFFKCARIRTKDSEDDVLVCKPDQGSAVLGVLSALAAFKKTKEVEFIGLAGAINKNLMLGQVIEVTTIMSDQGPHDITSIPTGKVVVQMVNSMIQTVEYYQGLLAKGVDIVEMESSYVLALAIFKDIPLSLRMIISDTIFDTPFWKIKFGDNHSQLVNEGIKSCVNDTIQKIKELLIK